MASWEDQLVDTFEQKTIRDPLLGMVADHMGKGHITCGLTQQVGCELVALLSAYREEERRLFPQVYLFGPNRADLIRAIAPGIPVLRIGEAEDGQDGPRQAAVAALKTCASLAIDGWCVFIRRRNAGFSFGLFRPAAETYSAGPEATLTASGLSAALLRHSAESTVEIINSAGGRLEISLTTAAPSNRATSSQILDFSSAASSDVAEAFRIQAAGYLARVLTEFLRGSHGTLLAAAPCVRALDPKQFSDGVILQDPIPLVQTMLTAMREKTAADASLLRSHESLLRGMMASDGVTILGTDGSIKAFRVFVQRLGKKKLGGQQGTASGGARSRAFDVLRSYVGKGLQSALVRSEDGRIEVVVKA
jgi:hypothetical protein